MSQLRFDPTTLHWTIMSPERCKPLPSKEIKDIERPCPFCPGNEAMAPGEIYRIPAQETKKDWRCRVIPNNHPVLRVEEGLERQAYGIFDTISGVGAHEVVIDTPEHDLAVDKYSTDLWADLFAVFQARITDLKNDIRLRYAVICKNVEMAGQALMPHPHSQIIALPEIPPVVKEILHRATEYYLQKERCMYCDLIHQESADKVRLVCENQDFLALCPYASSTPFEIRIYPRKHDPDFSTMDESRRMELADITCQVFDKLFRTLKQPAVHLTIHSAPIANDPLTSLEFGQWTDAAYHWHLVIVPEIAAGPPLALGESISVNTVLPEDAANFLRKIK